MPQENENKNGTIWRKDCKDECSSAGDIIGSPMQATQWDKRCESKTLGKRNIILQLQIINGRSLSGEGEL